MVSFRFTEDCIDSWAPLLCVTGQLEFVAESLLCDTDHWLVSRCTVDEDCTRVKETVCLQQCSMRPMCLMKIDTHGSVCGISAGCLIVW